MAVQSTAHIPAPIFSALQKASKVTGTDFQYLLDTAARESGFRASVKAPTSSATGLFQFIESTWLQMVKEKGADFGLKDAAQQISKSTSGRYSVADPKAKQAILNLRKDPEIASLMAGAFTQMNSQHLEGVLGRKPTSGELYIAHFLGSGQGGKLIKAAELSSDRAAADLFPRAAKANKSLFYRHGKALSVQDLYHNLVRRHAQSQIVKANDSQTGQPQTSIVAGISPKIEAVSFQKWDADVQLDPVVHSKSQKRIAGDIAGINVLNDGRIGVWQIGGPQYKINDGARSEVLLSSNDRDTQAKQGAILGDGLFSKTTFNSRLDEQASDHVRGVFTKGGLGRLKG